MCGYFDVWMCGCVDVWIYGYGSLWMYEFDREIHLKCESIDNIQSLGLVVFVLEADVHVVRLRAAGLAGNMLFSH